MHIQIFHYFLGSKPINTFRFISVADLIFWSTFSSRVFFLKNFCQTETKLSVHYWELYFPNSLPFFLSEEYSIVASYEVVYCIEFSLNL